MGNPMLSVVVCAKNEPDIAACIHGIVDTWDAGEIIVIAADEGTAALARKALRDCLVWRSTLIVSDLGSLSADRQFGADLATGDLVAFIDADHRLRRHNLQSMADQLDSTGADVLQARLTITPLSFWNRAESEFLAMTMVPGFHDMIGTAPTVFRREVLEKVRFADGLSIDDTSFMYRLHRDTEFTTAVAATFIECRHDPRLRDYLAKFRWYGGGDVQFASAHPERRRSMLFHLLVRYPFIHSTRAVLTGHFRAALYAVIQGVTRASCFIR